MKLEKQKMKKSTNKSSIINFSENILKEYSDFEKVNDNWNILSYLNYNFDTNAAIAFSKLYFPDFVEYEDCIILSVLFNLETFNEWFEELNGNIKEVEKMCNLYEVKDFFHINRGDEIDEETLKIFANLLSTAWAISLNKLYPSKRFKIDTFEEYDSLYITIYQI
jgi:hypothetical protein